MDIENESNLEEYKSENSDLDNLENEKMIINENEESNEIEPILQEEMSEEKEELELPEKIDERKEMEKIFKKVIV